MKRIRVFVVDDSALMRQLLTSLFSSDPELEVVGTASDPVAARPKIDALAPDVLTLDVEMPRMDGLSFLAELMGSRPMPVVMVSSLTERGCDVTLRALEAGAVDFVTKPKIDVQRGTVQLGAEIVRKVKAAAHARVRARRAPGAPVVRPAAAADAPTAHPVSSVFRTTQRIVVLGASTGGTEAIREILSVLPADAPPIVIVQHMPAVFTQKFAERLDSLCRVRVREARDGDVLMHGQVLIAPGGYQHLEIARSGAAYGVKLVDGPPLAHHRPAVDIMFESCARAAGANATGVLLTGMGADGARGLLSMRKAGATTFAEHESTAVVFGMPKEAIARGAAEHVLPLDKMAAAILRATSDTQRGVNVEGRR